MPAPTPDDLWELLVRTRLLEPAAAEALRAEHARALPAAAGDGSAKAIAGWLMSRGAITRWQAKRLAIGDAGPFFLGDYRLLERHEREGDALQFTARHEPSGRRVTLVLLNAKRLREPGVWDAIGRRASAACGVADPIASRTWAVEQRDGARFVVCELVEGANVAEELERLGPLPAQQAGVLAWQVATAVGELHAAGGVHGELSLDALRREPAPAGRAERSGRVRLLQFPLAGDPHVGSAAAAAADDAGLARLGRRVAFLAPEQLRSGSRPDPRADVYAIGAMLHALLTGRPPCWDGGGVTAVRAAATVGPEALPDAVPQALRDVTARMMARDPAQRYADARQAAGALASAVGLERPADRSAAPPAADVASCSRAAASRSRRQAKRFGLIGGLVAGAVLAAVGAVAVMRVDPGSGRRRAGGRLPQAAPEPSVAADREPSQRQDAPPLAPADSPGQAAIAEVVVDDDRLPWASPTHAPPPLLAYLPPGSQLVLLARLAEIAADAEGSRFVTSLGPAVEAAVGRLVTLCGGDATAIESVQAGWLAGDPDAALGGVVVRFAAGRAAPSDEASRAEAWGETTAVEIEGEMVRQSETLTFWLPSAEAGRVLVIAPNRMVPRDDALGEAVSMEPLIARVIRETLPLAMDREAAVQAALPGPLETLVGMLDADRHVTLFGSPHSLVTSGHGLVAGPFAKLLEPLAALLGEGVQAAAVSLHFGERCYVELDAVAALDVPPKALAPQLAGRVEGLGEAAETLCTALDADPYGRALVLRLPGMLRALAAQLRSGPEGKGVVLNAYLPRHAPHNIALAAELALAQATGAVSAPASITAAAGSARALDRLGRPMTLTFVKDDLERSIQMVSEETGVPMEILGGDLELEGITKNQSFGLDEQGKTAAEILRAILAKSNPEGKLVYVIQERDGVEWVLITTRAAVEKRGDTLPPAYASPP